MGVVDEDRGTVLLGGLDDAGQRADVAVHGEDAVGHHEDEPVGRAGLGVALRRGPREDGAQGGHVLVRVDLPARPREAHAVDDRGVVEGVADERSASPVTTGRTPVLAVKPDWKTSVASVPLKSARSRSSCSWSVSVPAIVRTAPDPTPNSRTARSAARAQAWVVGQSQVVVRREADDLAAVDRADRALCRGELTERAVEVLGPERRHLIGQEGQRVGGTTRPCVGHQRLQSRRTLPLSPERAVAKAAA